MRYQKSITTGLPQVRDIAVFRVAWMYYSIDLMISEEDGLDAVGNNFARRYCPNQKALTNRIRNCLGKTILYHFSVCALFPCFQQAEKNSIHSAYLEWDRAGSETFSTLSNFNSPPAWSGTESHNAQRQAERISIHPPHAGGTQPQTPKEYADFLFQSTHPVRGGTLFPFGSSLSP